MHSFKDMKHKCAMHTTLLTPFLLCQAVFMEIFNENSRYALQEHLHLITAPLQVIWGKQDQVVSLLIATELKYTSH